MFEANYVTQYTKQRWRIEKMFSLGCAGEI